MPVVFTPDPYQNLLCQPFFILPNDLKTAMNLCKPRIGLNGKLQNKWYSAIAKKVKAFDMKVIATRRLQKKVEHKKTVDELIPISKLSHLLKNSDFVVVACPLTPITIGMIDKRELSTMKSSAIIINIARGKIINEAALIKALQIKTIAGAALDVFEEEPLPKESPLFALDNVFLSPHISGNFPEYQHDVMVQFADNLKRYLAGKDLKNRVCKKRLY